MKRYYKYISHPVLRVCVLFGLIYLLCGCNLQNSDNKENKEQYVDYTIKNIPEFVNDIKECKDNDKKYVLPDGYIYESKVVPVYLATNQLSVATDENGQLYNECGYKDNARIRSILEIGESEDTFVTGYIPIKSGDKIYFGYNCFKTGHEKASSLNIAFYDSNREVIGQIDMATATEKCFVNTETNKEGYISKVQVNESVFSEDLAFVRFSLLGSGNEQFVSVNEPLEETKKEYKWMKTEKYVSADWYNEVQNTIETVENIKWLNESNVVKFMFASDIHLDPNSTSSYTEDIGKVCAGVMEGCEIPFFISGGDNCTQSTGFKPSDFKINMKDLLQQLSPIPQRNILLAVGNHDGATGSTYDENGEEVFYRFQLNNEERSEVFFGWQRESNENKQFDSDGTYFYLDDPETKTRYIVLNSHWSQWEGKEDGYVTDIQHSFFHNPMFGSKQLKWFADEALDMPAEYGAVIIAHFVEENKDFELFQGIVNAYSNQTTYEGKYVGDEEWQSSEISVNYKRAKGEIIALFQGHRHMDTQYDYFEKVPCINVTSAGAYWAIRDEYTVERVKGTSTEFAVDTVVIDRGHRKIYMIRLGAGEDRTFTY